MICITNSDIHHEELQKSRNNKDENCIKLIMETIINWVNPCCDIDELVSLST